MFFDQINMFKDLIEKVMARLECIEANQTEMLKKIQEVEIGSKNQAEKFTSCAMAFRQIRIVCESLTDRLDEACGTISSIDY